MADALSTCAPRGPIVRRASQIIDRSSLEDAIHVNGRAKNKEVVKQHVVAKGKALGLPDLISTYWPGSTK